MTLAEFKHALVRPMVTAGIKTLPGDLETQLLYEQVQKYYKHITLGDFYLAFELNSLGQSWVRVEHFNLFNLAFISDVLNRYLESKGKAVIQMQKAKPEPAPAPEVNNKVSAEFLIKTLTDHKATLDKNRENKFIATLFSYLIMQLYEIGALIDDDFSNEQWAHDKNVAHKYAKAMALQGGYSRDKSRIKETYTIELSRIIYISILSNEQLFNTVINRLKK